MVLSAVFAISGPFGTYETLALPKRTAFWLAVVGGSVVLGLMIRVLIQVWRPGFRNLHASTVATCLTAATMAVFLPQVAQALVQVPQALVPGRLEVAFSVLALGVGMTFLHDLLTPPAATVAAEGDDTPRLLSRLPREMAGSILHLSVSDHYVEVTTENGMSRVLMRFSDAIAEVAPVEGLRVHRSHWVARDAVVEVERCGGRVFVALRNGDRVPVSRGYRREVDALGLG